MQLKARVRWKNFLLQLPVSMVSSNALCDFRSTSMIEPKYFTLDKLFRDRVFRIPHYQRFYSWGSKQLRELFEDLHALNRKRNSTHHFMATIVCYSTGETKSVKTEQYNLYEVVDGQQRITTLALLFKALEQRLDDEDTKKNLSRVLVKDDNNLLLLQANNTNQHHFNQYLRDGKIPEPKDLRHSSDACLANAIKLIQAFLADWEASEGELLSLTALLKNRIGFVVYDTEDRWAVYSIFESLNSRGLAVDWLDKAKSVIMGIAFEKSQTSTAADALIDELHNLWARIYDFIASVPKDSDDILRIAATLFSTETASKVLSAEDAIEQLRDYCSTAEKTVETSNWLHIVAGKMVELRGNPTVLPIAKIFQARVLAISLMLTDALSDSERKIALEQLERVTFRIYGLSDRDSRYKTTECIKLAMGIRHKNDGSHNFETIMDKLRKLGKDHPIETSVAEYFKQDNYEGHEEECRYILWKYEEYLAEKEKAKINQEIRLKIWSARSASQTIEHILPQAHEKTLGWRTFEPVKAKKNVDKLANLILLPPGLNSEAGRKMFSEKVQVYKRAEGLRSVKDIIKLNVWDSKAFEARQKKLKDFVSEKFSDIVS